MEGETNGGGSGLKEIDKKVEEGDLNATNKQQANAEESVKPNEPIKMSDSEIIKQNSEDSRNPTFVVIDQPKTMKKGNSKDESETSLKNTSQDNEEMGDKQDLQQPEKDLDTSKEQDIDAQNKIYHKAEQETDLEIETESVVNDIEAKQKSKDTSSSEIVEELSKNPDIPKQLVTEQTSKIKSNSVVDVTNLDNLRKECNETPTYEAWRTGQVPSPLKRGKSCKTPSPPPCPEKITKASSVPTTGRISSGSRKSSNGTLRLSRENSIISTVDNPHIENKSNSLLKRQTSILSHKDSFDIQYKENMEHQNESGRETLEVFDSNSKTKGSAKEKISHSSSLRSDDFGDISQNVTRQNSISSAVSGTTRPDQGRADDFFDSARKDFIADALAENQLATKNLQCQVESLMITSNHFQKDVEAGKMQQDKQLEMLKNLTEQLESQEKKIADQQAVIMTFIEKEKMARDETEKKQSEEIEKERRERLEQEAILKKDMTENFDAKLEDIITKTENRVRELLSDQCEYFNQIKDDLIKKSEKTNIEMKCIKNDLANFNKVNKDFLNAVKDKMSSYDKRMEESEEKLKARLEDFEAERKDAELAFKVDVERRLDSFRQSVEHTNEKLSELTGVYDDVQDRVWEIEKSWRNNLVFHGVLYDDPNIDEPPHRTEEKVRKVIKTDLQMSREMHILRAQRITTGPQIRGTHPIVVSFENYRDKEDILRRSKLIRGNEGVPGNPGIAMMGSQVAPALHITEDTSRRSREHRAELLRFMKEVRKRHPEKHCVIRTDRLYVDHDYVYAWSERNQRIERLTTSSTCGSGSGGMGGGLATAAAERSMLRTPALRYADRLMEMDEDEIMTASNKYKHSSSNRCPSQQHNTLMGSTNNINIDDSLSPTIRRKMSGGGRESPIKLQ